ncbi:MAG TPA: AMP-binding protein [Bryobacteraceae bacterium]|nr:AMP-binding protein [Bryobacteraceae bacterium]
MPPNCPVSLREKLGNESDCSGGFLHGAETSVSLANLSRGTSLDCRLRDLWGRSVLLATRDQLATAVALIELDGVASRLVICPPDLPARHLPSVICNCGADAIVSDDHSDGDSGGPLRVVCRLDITPMKEEQLEHRTTDWVLLTSGTTGAPKMVRHDLGSLTAPIVNQGHGTGIVWGTFYDIRRYGGLQIFLRAVLGRGSLVLSGRNESTTSFLSRLGAHGVTHVSGTPSHWRRALMSPDARVIAPRYVRLSGEIADQAILNTLCSFYPQAAVSHAFASTEAGVAFEVNDGLEGFPASLLGTRGQVQMKIENDSLRVCSNGTAFDYVGKENGDLLDHEGFVDTGDIVELRGDRYYFLGRRHGVINIGGLKVYPEEVEAVINRHPAVRMSMVRSRRNPITGALVSADVVLKGGPDQGEKSNQADGFKREILQICQENLAAHKVPATIRCVPELEVAAAGKLMRPHA